MTTDRLIEQEPETVEAAVRALRMAQKTLIAEPERATEAARRLFPPTETELIAELIRRDAPYYDPAISEETVAGLNRFAQQRGLLSAPVPYDRVVATRFRQLWRD